MSVHKYTAGARTRNVVNLVQPGGTTGIVVGGSELLTAAIAAPTTAAHGYKNLHSQQNLHLVIKNNALKDNSNADVALAAAMTLNVTIWVYNSSLGGSTSPLWTKPSLPMSKGSTSALEFYEVPSVAVANGTLFRTILPLEGIERVAIQTTFTGGNTNRGFGDYSIWLGANTI